MCLSHEESVDTHAYTQLRIGMAFHQFKQELSSRSLEMEPLDRSHTTYY